MRHLWAQNGPFALNNFFGGKIIKIIKFIFIQLLAPFIVQNILKFFQRIQSYEVVQFWGPKWPICPNDNFLKKTC